MFNVFYIVKHRRFSEVETMVDDYAGEAECCYKSTQIDLSQWHLSALGTLIYQTRGAAEFCQ